MNDLSALEKNLGVTFKEPALLQRALVHRSYINEHPKFSLGHNERLEYLGDAVLELAVTEYLYANYPNPEGDLTNWRASLVNAKTLGKVAQSLGVDQYIYLSRGESKDNNLKARSSIMANAIEAIIGAMYLDQGFEVCQEFIDRTVIAMLPNIIENKLYLDPKSRLQEASQEHFSVTPAYKVLKEWGPDHDKHFQIAVFFVNDQIAVGEGPSKQEAQVSAAKAALEAKGW
ncbi:MAG: ribonuclease III [bacterium]